MTENQTYQPSRNHRLKSLAIPISGFERNTSRRPLGFCLLLGLLLTAHICSVAQAAEVTLAWDPNTEADLDGYTVYYSKGSPGPPYDYAGDIPLAELPNPQSPMVTLTDLEEQVSYYFAVTAYDINGNESSFSSSLCVYIDGSVGECIPSPALNPPLSSGISRSGGSSGGGSSGSGACFIGAAGRGPRAVIALLDPPAGRLIITAILAVMSVLILSREIGKGPIKRTAPHNDSNEFET